MRTNYRATHLAVVQSALAWYAIASVDYAAAIKSFQEIVARFPLEVEAYRRLALLLKGEERSEWQGRRKSPSSKV